LWVITNMINNQLQNNELKGHLFDLLINNESTSKKDLIEELVDRLQIHFSAEVVTFFSYNNFHNRFVLETSTYITTLIAPKIIDHMSSLYNYLLDGQVYIDTSSTIHVVYLPLQKNNRIVGLLSLQFINRKAYEYSWEPILLIITKFINKAYQLIGLNDRENRSQLLYDVTTKFHSSMGINDVLVEVISTLKAVYPTFTYYLLLSHDNTSSEQLPIKEIQYDDSNLAATQAYVTGDIQMEDSIDERKSSLYAPLKGKQGVYGVLQVIAPDVLVFPEQELDFISLLANTAGSALENAQLYQQSKRLITDLQLINETSHQLNSNLRLTEAMTFMSKQIIQSFGADEVGFILFEKNIMTDILPGSTDYFLNRSSENLIQYIYDGINPEKDALFIGDLKLDSQNGFRSLMAVPMMQGDQLRGIVIVLHQESYYFSFETFKLLQSLVHHSTLALTNSMLREELENLVITDYLTKLHTRKYLNDNIKKSMESDAFGTFLLIDIDDFKKVNDTYGHQVGDEILKQVANIIKDHIREFDIGARWGGEELAIYLPRVDLSGGIMVARRLVQKVEELTNPQITISCGVGHWKQGQPDTPITLFKRADEALYSAKGTGKNRVNVQELILK
jgi:diguanylate cyclase (GGDEF)-like protein